MQLSPFQGMWSTCCCPYVQGMASDPIQTELELLLLKRDLRQCCRSLIGLWLLERDEQLTDAELAQYLHRISQDLSPLDL